MRIRMTPEREKRLDRACEAMNEQTKSKAIDRALRHYLVDKDNKERVADDLSSELAEALSTGDLPIARETTVGVK